MTKCLSHTIQLFKVTLKDWDDYSKDNSIPMVVPSRGNTAAHCAGQQLGVPALIGILGHIVIPDFQVIPPSGQMLGKS